MEGRFSLAGFVMRNEKHIGNDDDAGYQTYIKIKTFLIHAAAASGSSFIDPYSVCAFYSVLAKAKYSFVLVDHLALMIIIVNLVDGGTFFSSTSLYMFFVVYSVAIGIEI